MIEYGLDYENSIDDIFELRLGGRTLTKIAEKYNVSTECIRQAIIKKYKEFLFKSSKYDKLIEEIKNLREELYKSQTTKTTREDPNLKIRIDNFHLSVRSSNTLKNENIVYIGDLAQKTGSEMLRIPNFGRKSLNELRELLAQFGLKFKRGWDE